MVARTPAALSPTDPRPPHPTRAVSPTQSPVRDANRSSTLSVGVLLVGLGSLWLLSAFGVELPWAVLGPALLVVLGIGVFVAGIRGENVAIVGLAVFLGVWLAIAVTITTVLDVPLAGSVGERTLVPATITELDDASRMLAGSQTLDLRDLDMAEGTSELAMSVVLGDVEVLVPEGMAVRVDAEVAGGSITLFDESTDGIRIADEGQTLDHAEASGRLDLELRVGLGEIVVRTP